MQRIRYKLGETIDIIGTTRNHVAVESKTRPATILDLVSGETKTIKLETMVSILDALNQIAKSKGIDRTFNVTDIIEYIPVE